ncbi:hypothetical protein OKW21_006353 [Catalinimonas alkaloidigena]|uniref:sulfotransferase family 2 domain-containing protein n=1 Tax=Catalinimonas alkaloidigena TaxID=1075417 RepID=UPI002404FA50|nr:sulfotransferase family 2 domain-containing protein [Catalinimonas alkaloidigena]MDF9801090.1 hypothetical protein [Catalinimonas alkaloidigena]
MYHISSVFLKRKIFEIRSWRIKMILKKIKSFLAIDKKGFIGDVIVFHNYKAAYFAIPKVANSSFKAMSVDLLADSIDNEYLDSQWKPYPFRNANGRKYLAKQRILVNELNEVESSYWKFAFVRDPWDRLASCFSEKINKKDANGKPVTSKNHIDGVSRAYIKKYGKRVYKDMPFHEFVDLVCDLPDKEADEHFISQNKFLTNEEGKVVVDYVGKLENLEYDFNYIKQKCKFPDHIHMPHLLKSSKGMYDKYYDDALRVKVRERYKNDIEMFDY